MEVLRLFTPSSYFDSPFPDMIPQETSGQSLLIEHIKEEDTPCSECGKQRSRRGSVASNPKSARAGRNYYPCTNSKCRKGSAGVMKRDFVVWDAHGDNPRCDCGLQSRQDVMGSEDPMPGYGYWACAFGTCKYFSRDRKGRSVENGEVNERAVQPFIPWLLYAR